MLRLQVKPVIKRNMGTPLSSHIGHLVDLGHVTALHFGYPPGEQKNLVTHLGSPVEMCPVWVTAQQS